LHVRNEDFTERLDPRRPEFKPITEPNHKYIRIDIKDTGLGIKASDMGKLFNKFVQADSTTTRNYGGTGLGLAISKKFVELMDGIIWIESEGLNKGTTVSFVVKLGVVTSKLADAKIADATEMADRTELHGLRVLVTDDNG
jgi:ethylene receptor